MSTLIIDVHETIRTTGTRVRELTDWYIYEFTPGIYKAAGRTVTDNGVVLDFIRLTDTSPIKYRKGRTLITESGSEYTLLEPHAKQDPNGYLMFEER